MDGIANLHPRVSHVRVALVVLMGIIVMLLGDVAPWLIPVP